MARKPDPRPERSRHAMTAALRVMLETRDLGQITAADIATAAGISRSTFYDHFSDIEDLAAATCTQQFDELLAAAPVGDLHSPEQLAGRLGPFFEHIRDNRRLYIAVLGSDGSASVSNHLHHRLSVAIRNAHSPAQPSPAGDLPPQAMSETRAAFLAGGLVAAATNWLQRGSEETPDEVAADLAAAVLGHPWPPPPTR